MKTKSYRLWILGGLLLTLPPQVHAQISLTGTSYSENFDGMSTNIPGSSTTPTGWFVGVVGLTNGAVGGTTVRNDSGGTVTGTNFNYGVAGVSSITNRALGSVATASGNRVTEVRFITCQITTNLNISYDGEQWGVGGSAGPAHHLTMHFSTDGTNFTAMGSSFTFTTLQDGTQRALDGHAASNRVAGIGGNFATNLADGTTFYLRWIDIDDTAIDHGLAVDNFTLTVSYANDPGTNRWVVAGSGKWEEPCNWSAGTPNIIQPFLYITNATSKTVTIDAVTTNTPSSLTISNLTITAPGGSTNTLFLNNAGTTSPLRVLGPVILDSRGAITLNNSAILATNQFFFIGSSVGNATLTITNGGAVFDDNGVIGLGSSNNVVVVSGAGSVWSNRLNLTVGSSSSRGNQLIITNGGAVFNNFGEVGNTSSNNSVRVLDGGTWRNNTLLSLGFQGKSNTLTIAGGSVIASNAIIGSTTGFPSNNVIRVDSGSLFVTNALGTGSLVVSPFSLGSGTNSLIINGGSVTVDSLRATNGVKSVVALNGGILTLRGAEVANGQQFLVGAAGQTAALDLVAGTNSFANGFSVGPVAGATGTVWMTGGRLIVTNAITTIGESGVGQMTVSNGTWLAKNVVVGAFAGSRGTLTIAGGTSSVYSNLIVGICGSATGIVNVGAGALYVTNSIGDAALDVRGTVNQSGGLLFVDRLVITNACGHINFTGGSLVTIAQILTPEFDADGDGIPNGADPGPLDATDTGNDPDGDGFTNLEEFQAGTNPTNSASFLGITSITQVSTNIFITWQTGVGKTNALERTTGVAGSFTNNFTGLTNIVTTGTTTNYLDVGAATNVPSLYYRVRLVP